MATYKYNKVVHDQNGYYRLKRYCKLQRGCEYREILLNSNGNEKLGDKGFFTDAEIRKLEE